MSKEIEELMKQVLGNGKAARRNLSNMSAEDYLRQSKASAKAAPSPAQKAKEEAEALDTSMGQMLRQQQAQMQELERQAAARARAASSTHQRAKKDLETIEAMGDQLNQQLEEQLEELKRMSQELDFDISSAAAAEKMKASLTASQPAQTAVSQPAPSPANRQAVAKAISNAAESMEEELPGQEAFLKQLGIAFKRPYVTGWDTPHGTRGTILVRGSKGSGRHLALRGMADALQAAGVPGQLVEMDLSLYPSNSQERLFLQDLYSALECGGIVVFDQYDKCHPAYLQQIAKLFTQGKLPLSARYVMQKGHLVDAGTALTKDTVKELTPDGCYLVL